MNLRLIRNDVSGLFFSQMPHSLQSSVKHLDGLYEKNNSGGFWSLLAFYSFPCGTPHPQPVSLSLVRLCIN